MGKWKQRAAREKAEAEAKAAAEAKASEEHSHDEKNCDCKTNKQMGNYGYTGYTGVVNAHLASRVDSQ